MYHPHITFRTQPVNKAATTDATILLIDMTFLLSGSANPFNA
jgi:hypothetical protein